MYISNFNNLSIGYIPYTRSLNSAGDRRRFIYFAKKTKLNYELYEPNKKYDLVIATPQADPEILLKLPSATKLIFDFADAYMAENQFSIRGLFRGFKRYASGDSSKIYLNYKKAFIKIMKRSEVVICSSPEQKKIIKPYCSCVRIILDSHIDECVKVKNNFNIVKNINIGWEGQHATLPSLLSLEKKISRTYLSSYIRLHIVTDEKAKSIDKFLYGHSIRKYLHKRNSKISFYPWSIENMNNLADICDFAILPVNLNNPMHALKPENRVHLFWRMGLPVIASATKSNIRAMNNCNHDLFGESHEDLINKIELLRNNPKKIYQYSKTAIEYVNSRLTSHYFINLWSEAIIKSLG